MLSTPLEERSLDKGLVTAAHYLCPQLSSNGMADGTAKRDCERGAMLKFEPALPVPLPADTLSSLEALPWMTQSGPSIIAVRDEAGPRKSVNGSFMLIAGIAATLAVLFGSSWYVGGETTPQTALAVNQKVLLHGSTSANPYAAAEAQLPDTVAAVGQSAMGRKLPAEAWQAPTVGQTSSESRAEPHSGPATMKPIATAPIAAPPSAGQAAKIDAAAIILPPAPPSADSPATAATLKEYRSTVEECRDAIRDIIRLGDRQRPGRNASADQQTSYRLRQQNAEAAKTYRSYLDTLARTMRGTNSETLTRQSIERARQTLVYVNTMLADSKASLL